MSGKPKKVFDFYGISRTMGDSLFPSNAILMFHGHVTIATRVVESDFKKSNKSWVPKSF